MLNLNSWIGVLMLNRYDKGFFAPRQGSTNVPITDIREYLQTRTPTERKLLIGQLCHGLLVLSFLIGLSRGRYSWGECLVGVFLHGIQACINVETDGAMKLFALAVNVGCMVGWAQQTRFDGVSAVGIFEMLSCLSGVGATSVAIHEGMRPKKKRW